MLCRWLAVPCVLISAVLAEDLRQEGLAKMAAGRYAEAYELLKKQWEQSREQLGASHLQTLITQCYVGQALTLLGRPREALDILGPAVREFESLQHVGNHDMLIATTTLAVALRESGNYPAAEKILEKVIATPIADAGTRSGIQAQYALALAYRNKRREAVKYAQEAVKSSIAAGLEGTPRHLHLMVSLGQIQLAAGKTFDAESTLRRVEKEAAGVLDENHPERATLYSGLAVVCYQRAAFREAEQYIRSALRLSESVLGPDHPEVAVVLGYLAVILDGTGKQREANEIQARSTAIFRRAQQSPVSVWSFRPVK